MRKILICPVREMILKKSGTTPMRTGGNNRQIFILLHSARPLMIYLKILKLVALLITFAKDTKRAMTVDLEINLLAIYHLQTSISTSLTPWFRRSSVQSRIICREDFPRAVRIPTGSGLGGRRWYAKEVKYWISKNREPVSWYISHYLLFPLKIVYVIC